MKAFLLEYAWERRVRPINAVPVGWSPGISLNVPYNMARGSCLDRRDGGNGTAAQCNALMKSAKLGSKQTSTASSHTASESTSKSTPSSTSEFIYSTSVMTVTKEKTITVTAPAPETTEAPDPGISITSGESCSADANTYTCLAKVIPRPETTEPPVTTEAPETTKAPEPEISSPSGNSCSTDENNNTCLAKGMPPSAKL
ncbi:hypothetical protein BU23DRAFT_289163 [Bimuria novae-zelandiae CBS 107.79]|uniref:Uncharacterized protein n=1 Tax=Bimuria novae-zelandiae CBS 107.79 TaxID=1447943 RepID=A0A6A5UU61_9PLEO|nr:hypothetical protein BU23DRAFT_289163 [Bimuria novae-zelandiae CBS 107.79]